MNESSADLVILARIVRPQGRRGELLAEIFTDFPELFADRKHVSLASAFGTSRLREVFIEGFWLHKGRVVLKFSGVDSISDAETLRGLDVVIPRDDRAQLEDGAYYISDLQGCRILNVSGTPSEVGEVLTVDTSSPGTPLLIVRPAATAEELLVPFAKSYLRRISLQEKLIEMELPSGLLEINAPLSDEERLQQTQESKG